MQRDEWTFTHTAEHLLSAATAQRDFRAARVKVWEEKKAEVIGRIRESGLTVTESLADGMGSASPKYNISTHSHRGAQITIDPTMQADLNECTTKVREHRELEKAFAAWVQVFEAHLNKSFDLDHDDWQFFFGR